MIILHLLILCLGCMSGVSFHQEDKQPIYQDEIKHKTNMVENTNGVYISTLAEFCSSGFLYNEIANWVTGTSSTSNIEDIRLNYSYWTRNLDGNIYVNRYDNLNLNNMSSILINDYLVSGSYLTFTQRTITTNGLAWVRGYLTLPSVLYTATFKFFYLVPRSTTPTYYYTIGPSNENASQSDYVYTDVQAGKDLFFNNNFGDYSTGYDNGYTNGLEVGQVNGYDNGYGIGYQEGYSAAIDYSSQQQSTALTIFTGIIEVGLLPVNVFLKMFEYEVFGINIAGLVSAGMTIAIVVIIIRVVTGKKDD